MPELPEVETMVRGLRPALAGHRLRALEVCDSHLLRGCTGEEVARHAGGTRIDSVSRRGKWVLFDLESDRGYFVIQPRMTGGFWLVPPERPEHVRLIFHRQRPGNPVWYCDARRLGNLCWYPDTPALEAALARSQGPDALLIDASALAASLKRTARGIKPALMDQKILAGIGNIYADEILWRAAVHPMRPANRLTPAEHQRIHAAIRPVLDIAIAAEGASFDAGYRTVLGLEGGFLAQNAVHRRAGQPCSRCGALIEKAYLPGLIGRPTYTCPECQRRRRRGNRAADSA